MKYKLNNFFFANILAHESGLSSGLGAKQNLNILTMDEGGSHKWKKEMWPLLLMQPAVQLMGPWMNETEL